MPYRLRIDNIGPIKTADISFGDLTVLVGPQASGKSILLQLLKLSLDLGAVQSNLKAYGADWQQALPSFLDAYLGENMHAVWGKNSSITWKGKPLDLPASVARQQVKKTESLFFIPAQRVLTMREGWPRPFSDYGPQDPYVVRAFSESLRKTLESELSLFPVPNRLKREIRDRLTDTIFGSYGVRVETVRAQKRLVLSHSEQSEALPFMTWSAGQREFIPLLLGLYSLLPSAAKSKAKDVEWVVIEELEMGLHPKGISAVFALVFDLLSRGYKVILSTHSLHVLDVAWGIGRAQEHEGKEADLLQMIELENTQSTRAMAETVLGSSVKVYYFDREDKTTEDISALNPFAEDTRESGWGGISEFSGRVEDTVLKIIRRLENKGKTG